MPSTTRTPFDSPRGAFTSFAVNIDRHTRASVAYPFSFGDRIAPVITVISPMPGTAPGAPGGFPADWLAARSTPIVLQVTDASPGLAYVAVIATLPGGVEEVVYRRGTFRGKYAALSSQLALTNGIQLSVRHADGWPPGSVSFSIDPIDAAGNVAA